MPHSHHSHSGQFCRHAAQGTTLEEVVLEAIRKGFKVFGLSEHCPRYQQRDLYPEEVRPYLAPIPFVVIWSAEAELYLSMSLSVRLDPRRPIHNLPRLPGRSPPSQNPLCPSDQPPRRYRIRIHHRPRPSGHPTSTRRTRRSDPIRRRVRASCQLHPRGFRRSDIRLRLDRMRGYERIP